MKGSFLSNLLVLVVANVLVKPFWIFGIDRTVQNYVGAEAYGLYFAAFNLTLLFHVLLDFGLNNFNNRAIARNKGLIESFLPNIFALKFLFAGIYVLWSLLLAYSTGFTSFPWELLGLLLLNQILISFILYFRSNLAALHLFRLDAFMSVLDKLALIAVVGGLMMSMGHEAFSIRHFVYGQSLGYGLAAAIGFMILVKQTGLPPFRIRLGRLRKLWRLSMPFALLGLLMSVYNRTDAFMIERLLGPIGDLEAGIYAAGFRIYDAVNMMGFALATLLLPMFSKRFKTGGSIAALSGPATRLVIVSIAGLWAISYLFGHVIITTLYPEATAYWSRIFMGLMASFGGVMLVYVYGSMLTARGSLKQLNILAGSGVLVNITLNLILIPKYHAWGATIATIATQWFVSLIHVVLAVRICRLPISLPWVWRGLAFIAGMSACTAGLSHLELNFAAGVAALGIATLGLAALLRFLPVRALLRER